MAAVQKQWCAWDNDLGRVMYTYDDVTLIMQSIDWNNQSQLGQQVTITLLPGVTGAQVGPGNVTSIPLAAGSQVSMAANSPLTLQTGNGNQTNFIVATNVKVGDLSISVKAQTVAQAIPAGAQVLSVLPTMQIPPVGQQVLEPPPYNVTVGSTGSVSVAAQNIPMVTITSHGLQFLTPPAILTCGG